MLGSALRTMIGKRSSFFTCRFTCLAVSSRESLARQLRNCDISLPLCSVECWCWCWVCSLFRVPCIQRTLNCTISSFVVRISWARLPCRSVKTQSVLWVIPVRFALIIVTSRSRTSCALFEYCGFAQPTDSSHSYSW